ncbi:hypothetical protein D3C71_1647040 [compost metagenome]
MYSQTLERMAHTASSSECCTVNMVIGIAGWVCLISSNNRRPAVSGRSKCMQIMSACSPMENIESLAGLQSQVPTNWLMSSWVDRSWVRSNHNRDGRLLALDVIFLALRFVSLRSVVLTMCYHFAD